MGLSSHTRDDSLAGEPAHVARRATVAVHADGLYRGVLPSPPHAQGLTCAHPFVCQRAAGRSRRVCERLLRIVQSALLAFYLADLDDLWRYQHVLGELHTEWCDALRADVVESNASPLCVRIARRACS